MLNEAVKKSMASSVLCWLATADEENIPNVSPKEIFDYYDNTILIVANIASPVTSGNIKMNPHVCVSFIDIFIQKGFKIKGLATVMGKENAVFSKYHSKLLQKCNLYPIKEIFEIKILQIDTITAPGYIFKKDTTEEEQIKQACITYNIPRSFTT